MGRIVALDYGRARTGIAVTDPLGIIAGPLATVKGAEVIDYLRRYTINEPVDRIVIGYAKQMNNQESENMKYVRPFVGELKKAFPEIEMVYYDERFTSVLAKRAMIDAGARKKMRKDKSQLDQLSAVIILQDYLESIR